MPNYGYLAHHGIKGQKWGVRRYQNYDGSLTTSGKLRYYDKNTKVNLYNHDTYTRSKKNYGKRHADDRWKTKDQHDINDDLIFEKGSNFERISSSEIEEFRETGRLYVTQLIGQYDNDYFINDFNNTFIKSYENVEDIKIAGQNTVNSILNEIGEYTMVSAADDYRKTFKRATSDDIYMDAKHDKESNKIANKLTDELLKKGYSGIIDFADAGRFSDSAYIIVSDKALKRTKTTPLSEYR